MGQNELGKYLEKEIKKWKKGKGGASRPRPRFWPAGRSRPSPPTRHPLHAREPCPRAWTAAPRRRGTPAALGPTWRACARVDAPWSATRCARPRPPPSPLLDALLHSHSRPLSRPRAAADRVAAPASSLTSMTTGDSASPFRTQRSRSIALGKPCAPVRAHRSESELRRPLGSCGSPSPLRHCLRFRAR